jgi:lipoate---protein ligase
MYLLDVTLDTPAANLALDEALLAWAESRPASSASEVLRLWEPDEPFVVVGRSSQLAGEVNLTACRQRGIPVLRRASGGAAIVTGPGCLMYAVVLDCVRLPELRAVDYAHAFVLGRLVGALRQFVSHVHHAGTSDLVLDGVPGSAAPPKKFSGNSLRVKRTHLLYHGTILYDFDLRLVETSLCMPPRQPDYRAARPHHEFITNVPVAVSDLRAALVRAWDAHTPLAEWPRAETEELVASRYQSHDWKARR